ncbi:MAG: hypothetical protein ACTSQI_22080 [Candidatus Helarchaeota archaeon]
MHYSEKMKVGTCIGLSITCVFILSTTYTDNLLLLYPAIMFALISGLLYESSADHFKKNLNAFSSKMKFCYSCGHPLQDSNTAKICPNCNSKLNLLELMDV